MKFNPFRPNSIASFELFQGRKEEMNFIEQETYFYLRNSEDAIPNGAVAEG